MSILNRTRRKPPPTQVEANLTSMIDVVFLLIVFFILVSQVVNREAEPLDLPEVPDAAAKIAGEESRLVVNVLSDAEQPGVGLRAVVQGQPFAIDPEGCQALAKRVAVDLESRPDLAIHLRADREVHFEWIQPIMDTLRAASAHVEGAEAKVHLVLLEPAS
ncbi:MAG: hypothetical protein CMJ30_08275 [Phycisphaerae bacterium]|mgnify:CR=1 FL=1|jgi:biopolymer transport protein ExbD|nr:hypothetical protein [Phycisphaerae bacterium]